MPEQQIDERDTFYLGGALDAASGERTGEPLLFPSHHLTTHGVIVGMTGSGKTGLGIDLLEEALLDGVPCLVIDPKGDMGNLSLNFPEFRPSDFRPWIDEGEATRKGEDPDEVAAETAMAWREGLASWGIDGERMRRLDESAGVTIYTPGSDAGVPLNIVGSLEHPGVDVAEHAEILRDEIEGYVSSLLTLADIDADPVSSREHILVSNIVEHAWIAGQSLTLADLIGEIPNPSRIRKLGVFDLDTFFPEDDRMDLALRLNALVASPSFRAWTRGRPLDVGSLLSVDGRPRAAVVYLAHLSDRERQFVVTLLLSKLITWMRTQPGTSALRALVYMDEVFGFAPPTAEPPSKKPILTILKQARAFGVGMVLSTQNPVDLDYKAMSNAGTWMVGRLQTERDKARVLEGMSSAAGTTDVSTFDDLISGLGVREFVLQSTRRQAPLVFATRWAQSYLAGPLTRAQVEALTEEDATPGASSSTASGSAPAATVAATPEEEDTAADTTPVAPRVAEGIGVAHVTDSAPWLALVGAGGAGNRFEPIVVATIDLLYDDRHAGVQHTETFEAVIHPIDDVVTDDNLIAVDHDERDFRDAAPDGAVYGIVGEKIQNKTWWRELESSLVDHLHRSKTVEIFKNPELKLYSRVGESEGDFLDRSHRAAADRADAEVAKLRDKYAARIDRVRDQISAAERRVSELEVDVSSRSQQEILGGAADILGAVLGGKRATTAIKGAANRRSQARRTRERLETARAKVDDKLADIEELEDDLADDIVAITDDWDRKAAAVETVEIGLERTDIGVHPLRLAWVRKD